MSKTYPSQDRLKQLFSYDAENDCLLYAVEPYHKPHLLGRRAGRVDRRDSIYYVCVDRRWYAGKMLVSIFLTGAIPEEAPHHSQWTHDTLKSLAHYDPETGVFTRLHSAGSKKAGSRADFISSENGYCYVILNGQRFMAARLAWLYMTGEWPKSKVCVQDGNTANMAFSNLGMPKWGDLRNPKIKSAYEKAHRKSNPEWHRKQNLKRDFGLTEEQYQKAFVEQGGVCACCQRPEATERNGKRKWLAVDHDHKDGTFRGLLCASCNNGLGRFGDGVETMRRAIAYLEAHAAKPKTNVIPLAGRRIANSKGES